MLIRRDRPLRLYQLPGCAYVRVADTVGSMTANLVDVGSQAVPHRPAPLRPSKPGGPTAPSPQWSGCAAGTSWC